MATKKDTTTTENTATAAPSSFTKAAILEVYLSDYSTKDGRKFSKIEFEVVAEGNRQPIKGNMSVDYAKKYFGMCGVKGSELKGRECFVVIRDEGYFAKDGTPRKVKRVKYLNLIDENGAPIIMPKEETADGEKKTALPF